MSTLPCFAIVVAGGKGIRLDPQNPKQYIPICGKPILVHTLERIFKSKAFEKCIVVIPCSNLPLWSDFCLNNNLDNSFFIPAQGGASRFESVGSGLKKLYTLDISEALIAVHDGVRPLINNKFIYTCLKEAEAKGNAIPAVTPVDSFRYISNENLNNPLCQKSIIIDRNNLRSIQTPQCALYSTLTKAWMKAEQLPKEERKRFTDEASVLEYFGEEINICEGYQNNIKITHPSDLKWASFMLQSLDNEDS